METMQAMTPEHIKQVIQRGQRVSIATELRPSTNKSATGEIQPFYCSRVFTHAPDDRFACTVMNYADPNGKVPLVKIVIKGHNAWQGEHPIAPGEYNLDYIADEAYEVTSLHQGFADVSNKFPANGLNKWEVNVMQDVKGKAFPLFSLVEGQTYVDTASLTSWIPAITPGRTLQTSTPRSSRPGSWAATRTLERERAPTVLMRLLRRHKKEVHRHM